jgi:hypothetical protein
MTPLTREDGNSFVNCVGTGIPGLSSLGGVRTRGREEKQTFHIPARVVVNRTLSRCLFFASALWRSS